MLIPQLVAIDPGDKNTGMVRLRESDGVLIQHYTWDPEEVLEYFTDNADSILLSRIVVERFQLYPGVAQKKGWSEWGRGC